MDKGPFKGMSTWETLAAIVVSHRGEYFSEEGLERGLKEAAGVMFEMQKSIPLGDPYTALDTTISALASGHLVFLTGDLTGYRVTSDIGHINSMIYLLGERGIGEGRLRRLQPMIDKVWEHAPYDNRQWRARKKRPAA